MAEVSSLEALLPEFIALVFKEDIVVSNAVAENMEKEKDET